MALGPASARNAIERDHRILTAPQIFALSPKPGPHSGAPPALGLRRRGWVMLHIHVRFRVSNIGLAYISSREVHMSPSGWIRRTFLHPCVYARLCICCVWLVHAAFRLTRTASPPRLLYLTSPRGHADRSHSACLASPPQSVGPTCADSGPTVRYLRAGNH